jgi:hypothetical protein
MEKIIFNAQFRNTKRRVRSISGRLGNFIFRTHKDGHISAFYKPKKREFVEPLSRQHRAIIESLSRQLREITDMLAIEQLSFNFDIKDES